MKRRRGDVGLALAVFASVFLGHFLYGITTSFDSRFAIHVAMSIVRRHTTSLDAYPGLKGMRQTRDVNGHTYSAFPIGTPLLATPFVAAIDFTSRRLLTVEAAGYTVPFDLERELHLQQAVPVGIERFMAAVFTATSSVLVFVLARQSGAARARALIVVLVYAFGTSVWSTASRGLWQHGPTMMLLAAALELLVLARRFPWCAALSALPLAFSYVVRPTNSVSIVVFGLYVLLEHRRQLAAFVALGAAVAAAFFAYNLSVDGALLPPYYRTSMLVLRPRYLAVVLANWISPSRGILAFSPVLVFALWGARERIRRGTRLDRFVAAAIGLHVLAISAGRTWTGDYCFGNRYFSDVLPYFAWFLVPAVERVARSRALIVVFALLAGTSFAIHRRGVTSWDVYNWCLTPVYIEQDTSRAWSLRDVQFLRGL